jgi:hypothetical protein
MGAEAGGALRLSTLDGVSAQEPASSGSSAYSQLYRELTSGRIASSADRLRVSGWAAGPGPPLLAFFGKEGCAETTIRRYPRQDVQRAFGSVVGRWPTLYAGFSAETPYSGGCILAASVGGGVTEIPLRTGTYEFGDVTVSIESVARGDTAAWSSPARARVVQVLVGSFRLAVPVSILAAVAALAIAGARRPIRRWWTPAAVPVMVLLASVAARLSILGFLEATAFSAMTVQYLSPGYPMVLAAAVLSLAGAARALREKSPASAQPTARPDALQDPRVVPVAGPARGAETEEAGE